MKHSSASSPHSRRAESGNALWFILLAIALLGALTMTISSSSDTSEQAGDIERARIYATDVLRFATGVEKAVEQMQIRDISENDISFDGPAALTGYTNANCTDNSCLVFHAEGGGLTYKTPATDISSGAWLFTGSNAVDTYETSRQELLAILPGISQALCTRINIELDIAGIPQDTGNAEIATKYTGSFPAGQIIQNMGGAPSGCFEGNQDGSGTNISGTYYFYHTLIAR